MARMIPARHRWRQAAEGGGIVVAIGRPLPEGRYLTVFLAADGGSSDHETTARWRGRRLAVEMPARLPAQRRQELHAALRSLAAAADCPLPVAMDVVIGDGAPVLVDVHQECAVRPVENGVCLHAEVWSGDPVLDAERVQGIITRLEIPTGPGIAASASLELGDPVPEPAGASLATVMAHGADRDQAVSRLRGALAACRIDGVPSSLALLRQAVDDPAFAAGLPTHRTLDGLAYAPCAIEVLAPGLHTAVQDHPGRLGAWDVGVPPSGPMDDLALRLANRLLGNAADAAGLECTIAGPALRFHVPTIVCLTGADFQTTLDGASRKPWRPFAVAAGQVLRVAGARKLGCRAYLAVRHGLDVPVYLGSRATFDLGGFGGHAGRALRAGDLVPLMRAVTPAELATVPAGLANAAVPVYTNDWEIGVLEGPHGAPEFFTPDSIVEFHAARWEVHHNSSRTGIRLVGPKPTWARSDGGEAGLHPSNIHDNAYAVGAVDFTGDMPIVLGVDGPSLGGFVCPVTVAAAERWKLGQLRPGDRVRFKRLTAAEAAQCLAAQEALITGRPAPRATALKPSPLGDAAVLRHVPAAAEGVELTYRRSGDRYLLVEFGQMVLDLELRLRVHLLMRWVEAERQAGRLAGIIDLTPGIRSLQVHFDPRRISLEDLIAHLRHAEDALGGLDQIELPTRVVNLPLSWDDPATRLAIERYMRSVRPDAPWCPSNIEFIRRINGLTDERAVREIVFNASYLTLGLGDVYLGAPVATPVDPRHRLVTTKYNPARTWTPPNAVGIGGAYMCIYGMEGPGGYQFVGRTVPVWNTWRQTADFTGGRPWLLRFFDQIRFHPVTAAELLRLREHVTRGTHKLEISEEVFRLADHRRFLADQTPSIAAFRNRQRAAFAAERDRWSAAEPRSVAAKG